MQKIIIIPDSFKGSMSSTQVSDLLERAIFDSFGQICGEKNDKKPGHRDCKPEIIKLPIADGGEGSVDCLLRTLGGTKEFVTVKNPEGIEISAYYGISNENVAFIEIAESSGLTKQKSFRAMEATTYGFGQLILAALDKGIREFLLCLGGSATTDAGCGMAAALGVRFINEAGESFVPVGGTLHEIRDIDFTGLDQRILQSKITVMSDVENPLYGPNGAAYVYAGQKGASEKEKELLDKGLFAFHEVLKQVTHTDYESFKGGGAAGGAGLGCVVFLKAQLQSGIDTMLSLLKFEESLKECDLVVTGEGKLDEQSLMGKVLCGIVRHTKDRKIPVASFCGICKVEEGVLSRYGVTAVEISKKVALEEAIQNGPLYLKKAAMQYFDAYFQREM